MCSDEHVYSVGGTARRPTWCTGHTPPLQIPLITPPYAHPFLLLNPAENNSIFDDIYAQACIMHAKEILHQREMILKASRARRDPPRRPIPAPLPPLSHSTPSLPSQLHHPPALTNAPTRTCARAHTGVRARKCAFVPPPGERDGGGVRAPRGFFLMRPQATRVCACVRRRVSL